MATGAFDLQVPAGREAKVLAMRAPTDVVSATPEMLIGGRVARVGAVARE